MERRDLHGIEWYSRRSTCYDSGSRMDDDVTSSFLPAIILASYKEECHDSSTLWCFTLGRELGCEKGVIVPNPPIRPFTSLVIGARPYLFHYIY